MLDFRSDTVTKPTEAMRKVMYEAEVGDDVYGEDPNINSLQELVADKFNMEAGIFTTSGTQANLMALMSHCARGDEYIVGQVAHTYKYEAGGGAVLGSIQPQPVDLSEDGSIDLELAKSVIKPDDHHFANTRLFCLENTQGGKALPLAYLNEAKEFARSAGLAFHLDGARIFNAAVFHGVNVSEISSKFDSVACCFSKGLGAPVGSILCGSRDFINDAHRWRKMLGGGMRQAGVLAAAARYAVENHVDRLAEDHENAKWISEQLSAVDEIEVHFHKNQTNMIFLTVGDNAVSQLAAHLRKQGIVISRGSPIRIVTHLDVNRNAAAKLVDGIKAFFSS